MRISFASAYPLLLVSALGCGSESSDDGTGGVAGSSPSAGSSGGPAAGSGGNSAGTSGGNANAGKGGNPGAGGSSAASGGSSGTTAGAAGNSAGQTNGGAGGVGGVNAGGIGGDSGGAGSGTSGTNTGGAGAGSGGTSAGAAGAAGAGGANGGVGGVGGKGGSGSGGKGTAGAGGALSNCPADGNITYTLARNASPTAMEQMAYDRITTAMDRALEYYNCYTDIARALSVTYVPSVATADGNPNGSIRFGSMDSMNYITAMHETSHVLGVGAAEFDALIVGGVFTGPVATAELREIDNDPSAEVHGDNQHFWPYGLNYPSEVMSEADLLKHMRMVIAIRSDIGL